MCSENGKSLFSVFLDMFKRCMSKSGITVIPKKYNFYNSVDANEIKSDILFISLSSSSEKSVDDVISSECYDWPLPVEKWKIQDKEIHVYINKKKCFQEVIQCILNLGANYGRQERKNKTVKLTYGCEHKELHEMNLTEFRVHIFKDVLSNLLDRVGYDVSSEYCSDQPTTHLHIATQSKSYQLLCGKVYASGSDSESTELLVSDYFNLRASDLRVLESCKKYEHQTSQFYDWNKFVRLMGNAAIITDLVSVRPNSKVPLNMTPLSTGNRQYNNKGAAYVLYNCARIAAILRKFQSMVETSYYPPLISLEETDFSLLTREEEWFLLFHFLLKFPIIIEDCVGKVEQEIVKPHLLCQFLFSLSHFFSRYYRKVQILTEPRDHLMPVMFARLYLLKATEQVLHICLSLLNICPVSQM